MEINFDIVAYDENCIYLKDGTKLLPPEGCKFDTEVIKKIMEVGE